MEQGGEGRWARDGGMERETRDRVRRKRPVPDEMENMDTVCHSSQGRRRTGRNREDDTQLRKEQDTGSPCMEVRG